MPELFRRPIGSGNLKYTKYSCVPQTSPRRKISRPPLLLISSELPCWENSEEILCGSCRSFSADPSVWKAWSTQSTPALSKPRLDKKLSPSALADFFRASLLVGNSEEIPHAYCPLSGLSLRGPARGRGNLAGSFRIFEDPRRIRNMVPESPTPLRSLE